jgi:DNA-directed RNA polymerase specialized sigma24 family protein
VIERDDARHRLARLKPAERTALGMRAAGLSYAEIGELRGWTYTKVNRCIRGALLTSLTIWQVGA